MPIANCIVTPSCQANLNNLIELWANESGLSAEHMTINIITGTQQHGNKYSIMATLCLPSIWSNSDISSLQLGLAKALEKKFDLPSREVHVITQVISSGMVVEAGDEIQW